MKYYVLKNRRFGILTGRISKESFIAINFVVAGAVLSIVSLVLHIHIILFLGGALVVLGLSWFPSFLVGYALGGYYFYLLALEYSGLTKGDTNYTAVYYACIHGFTIFSLLIYHYRKGNLFKSLNRNLWTVLIFTTYILIQYVLFSKTAGATKKLGFFVIMGIPALLAGTLLDRNVAVRALKIAFGFAFFLSIYNLFKLIQNPTSAMFMASTTAMTTFNYHGQTYLLSSGFIIMMSLVFFRKIDQRSKVILYLIFAIYIPFFFIALILAGSRGGTLGFVVIMIIMLVYIFIYKRKSRKIGYVLAFIFIAIMMAFIWNGVSSRFHGGAGRLMETKQLLDLTTGDISESETGDFISERVDIIRDEFERFAVTPIIGIGFGNASENYAYAHNYLLEVLFETGVIGLILLILILYKVVKQVIKIWKESILKPNNQDNFLVVFTFLWVYFAIVGLFSSSLFDSYYLWFCIGAIWNPLLQLNYMDRTIYKLSTVTEGT